MSKRIKKADVVEKHSYRLCDIIKTEEWLNDKAQQGLRLVQVKGREFYFVKTAPFRGRYFLMEPDYDDRSDDGSWVFYEFERSFGHDIPCTGTWHALFVEQEQIEKNTDLINYYFDHRNYRLARRLLRDSLMGFAISAGMIAVCCQEWSWLLPMLPYWAGGGIWCVYSGFSLLRFMKTCRPTPWRTVLKRPRRPGY